MGFSDGAQYLDGSWVSTAPETHDFPITGADPAWALEAQVIRGGTIGSMSDSPPPSSDRRSGDRYLACFPAAVERPDGEQRPSLIRDLSVSGALLLVPTTKLAVGDVIKLQLYIANDPGVYRAASARVVRVEELSAGDAGPWRRRIGVQFEEPLTMYEADINAFRERAARLGFC